MLWDWTAHLRETLKPKTLLYSFMSFFSRVLFPAPDGPLSTTGLGPAIAEGEEESSVKKASGWGPEELIQSHWNITVWVIAKPKMTVYIHKVEKRQQFNVPRQASLWWDKHNNIISKRFSKATRRRVKNISHRRRGNQPVVKWWGHRRAITH